MADSVYKTDSIDEENPLFVDGINMGMSKTLDESEKNRKKRVGQRIRRIREIKGISRAELGKRIGLNSDRLQKYENGAQMPRNEMIVKIADELGVNVLSLVDPVPSDTIGALFVMFEMEHVFRAQIEAIDNDKNSKMALTFGEDTSLYKYMKYWCLWKRKKECEIKEAKSEEEKDNINHSYLDWEWNIPFSLYNNRKALDKMVIKSEIDRLQKLYDEADE